jgi:hypothetical protein
LHPVDDQPVDRGKVAGHKAVQRVERRFRRIAARSGRGPVPDVGDSHLGFPFFFDGLNLYSEHSLTHSVVKWAK